ncbi:MAG: type II toxin-antitoxin system RelE/ParE family toxin [Lentisphaeria bacterium]|nr:type II toxin-antitoxin system RelE/ParE family toxin [Lentisphaeria bacterium]
MHWMLAPRPSDQHGSLFHADCPSGLDRLHCRMNYHVELKPRSIKDLRHLPKEEAARVLEALENLQEGFSGNVKRLTNYSPEYRLRVGNYRVLFEVEKPNIIIVYRILHRKDAYR